MSVAPGTRFGRYEVVAPLGAGGMGEVYTARDLDLQRSVALKVLPAAVGSDSDRLARFAREAQMLAALNHPNIASIYGVATRDGAAHERAIVMELVDGSTLAERILRGALPIDDVLSIAAQLVDALDAAHAQGIVHRDLKPANIKIRADGTVKVLDFGLAKAIEPLSSDPEGMAASTITSPALTVRGVILGTAAYMSPEQAAGKPVDKRTDIWAFGVVLFEMLSGRRPFEGDDIAHVLAAVLKTEPDWAMLPTDTPASIRRLLRRCLQKDRRQRLADISDARLELDDARLIDAVTSAPLTAQTRRTWWPAIAAFVAGAILTGAWFASRPAWAVAAPARAASLRFVVQPPASAVLNLETIWRAIAISPDGARIVYVAGNSSSGGPLMLQSLDGLVPLPVAGVPNAREPFFSPDGNWIGYMDHGLRKVPVAGGVPVVLVEQDESFRGATWADDDTIVFATSDPAKGLYRVPPGGGAPAVMTTPDAKAQEGPHVYPSALPGARGTLFTILPAGTVRTARIAVFDPRTGGYRVLFPGTDASYVDSGHLVYALNGSIRAVKFDVATLSVSGDSWLVAERVVMSTEGAANFAVSRTGTLALAPERAKALRVPVWVDRSGSETPVPDLPPATYMSALLSPDGGRIALASLDDNEDIFTWDLNRRTLLRITSTPERDQLPIWMPDGESLVFSSNRSGRMRLYRQRADGTGVAEQIGGDLQRPIATAVLASPPMLFLQQNLPASEWDLFTLPLASGAGVSTLLQQPRAEFMTTVAPGGEYFAYGGGEDGDNKVFVRRRDDPSAQRWVVSPQGGTRPMFSRDGRELFYLSSDALMAVRVETTGAFTARTPQRLFSLAPYVMPGIRPYDITADGKRFLFLKPVASPGPSASSAIVVVTQATSR
ncbi:MAG TPA: protein kinase [Vicinamibacterales bacterium]|nr:protein kinase [Vicinamibacterales bacterium]